MIIWYKKDFLSFGNSVCHFWVRQNLLDLFFENTKIRANVFWIVFQGYFVIGICLKGFLIKIMTIVLLYIPLRQPFKNS